MYKAVQVKCIWQNIRQQYVHFGMLKLHKVKDGT